jgi:hypothetical protein
MTVAELIETLQAMPGHWPVHVATVEDGSGGGADEEYLFILEVVPCSFPTYGNFCVIRTNPEAA